MKLHVRGLSIRRSLVLVTVVHLDLLQFVCPALELALFARPEREEQDYPDNQHNQEGKSIREDSPSPSVGSEPAPDERGHGQHAVEQMTTAEPGRRRSRCRSISRRQNLQTGAETCIPGIAADHIPRFMKYSPARLQASANENSGCSTCLSEGDAFMPKA